MTHRRRVALVTGGTRGIGLAIACHLAREGFDLAVCGTRSAEAAAEAVDGLREHGADVLYVCCDVADRKSRTALLDAVRQRFHRLHVLVNNAGIAPTERRDLLDATEESFEQVLRVNLQGPYFLTQAVGRWLIEQRRADRAFRGCVVNISSVSATTASINRGEYCVAKAGLSMATQLWATRLGEWDIPVYEVRPGIIHTDMTAGVKTKYDRLIGEGLLVQARWGETEDVGRAVAMLARGDLPYSTGQVLAVDGGMAIPRL
jgi:NAD(P)-dependent dehydrogenase (short-subunit alcohol dehydrogenase family)